MANRAGSRRYKYLLALAAASLAVITVAIVVAVGGNEEERVSPLFVEQRQHLSMCVEVIDGAMLSDDEVGGIAGAFRQAISSAGDAPQEYMEPTFDQGCPTPIILGSEELEAVDLCCTLAKHYDDAASISRYRLFIYFVPEGVFEVSFGADYPYARVTAELLCKGDVCREVTHAVYAVRSISADVLATQLLSALGGLIERTPKPPINRATCEYGGTATSGCSRYFDCVVNPEQDHCQDEEFREIFEP